jgi:hypothetical protein
MPGSVGGLCAAIPLAPAAACEPVPPATVTVAVTVHDSAGARITLSQDSELVFGTVDPTPTLSLGGPDEADGARGGGSSSRSGCSGSSKPAPSRDRCPGSYRRHPWRPANSWEIPSIWSE